MSPVAYVASVANFRLRKRALLSLHSGRTTNAPPLQLSSRTTVNTKTIFFSIGFQFLFSFSFQFSLAGAKLFPRTGTHATRAIIYEYQNFAESVRMNRSFIRLLSFDYM